MARRQIDHIILHTAASKDGNRPVDAGVERIRAYHIRGRGWSEIGYHYVVRFDGKVEKGRSEAIPGAGVAGFNAHTIHVCLSGHGDLAAPTPEQWDSAVRIVALLCARYKLPVVANPNRVLGHREVWYHRLVPKVIRKTCPGKLVDMAQFRRDVVGRVLSDGKA